VLDGILASRAIWGEASDPRTHLARCYPELDDAIPPLDRVSTLVPPLIARVNHGTWIASCDCGAPPGGVPSAGGLVWFEAPWIWCLSCQNAANGHAWRAVDVPPPRLRQQIDAVLAYRPEVETRNWNPTETVADLVAENRAHGCDVPDGRG
jgi:hypothetical protein